VPDSQLTGINNQLSVSYVPDQQLFSLNSTTDETDWLQPQHIDIRQSLHTALIEALDLRRHDVSALSDRALRQEAEKCVAELINTRPEIDTEAKRRELITLVSAEAVGLGVLESLLDDSSISEIMVNKFDLIYVERNGKIERHQATFSCDMAVRSIIDRIAIPLGRRIDESSPMVDARLKDGSRLNAVIPPVALHGACLTIRKFAKNRLTMNDLVTRGSIDPLMAELLKVCIDLRLNIIVSGGTGSGKTTLLNILGESIRPDQRIVTIEDSAELQIHHPHVISLEARPVNTEGSGQISIRDLVRNAMRMRPDRIIVGEVRGAEALDMLIAMNTGHEGSLTTLHANSPRDALSRIETLVLMANAGLPLQAIREQVSSAVDIIVQQSRLSCGRRLVTSVAEITGIESGVVQLQVLANFDAHTETFNLNPLPPSFFERLDIQNNSFVKSWFAKQ
jgi:pilus assembly protein CpaF